MKFHFLSLLFKSFQIDHKAVMNNAPPLTRNEATRCYFFMSDSRTKGLLKQWGLYFGLLSDQKVNK